MSAFDFIILDEALGALSTGIVSLEAIRAIIKKKPESAELVLTGRNAPEQLVELADYVSEIKAVKHPYDRGISARRGIEF
jgi:cob(I)alamin adenosyltransferase